MTWAMPRHQAMAQDTEGPGDQRPDQLRSAHKAPARTDHSMPAAGVKPESGRAPCSPPVPGLLRGAALASLPEWVLQHPREAGALCLARALLGRQEATHQCLYLARVLCTWAVELLTRVDPTWPGARAEREKRALVTQPFVLASPAHAPSYTSFHIHHGLPALVSFTSQVLDQMGTKLLARPGALLPCATLRTQARQLSAALAGGVADWDLVSQPQLRAVLLQFLDDPLPTTTDEPSTSLSPSSSSSSEPELAAAGMPSPPHAPGPRPNTSPRSSCDDSLYSSTSGWGSGGSSASSSSSSCSRSSSSSSSSSPTAEGPPTVFSERGEESADSPAAVPAVKLARVSDDTSPPAAERLPAAAETLPLPASCPSHPCSSCSQKEKEAKAAPTVAVASQEAAAINWGDDTDLMLLLSELLAVLLQLHDARVKQHRAAELRAPKQLLECAMAAAGLAQLPKPGSLLTSVHAPAANPTCLLHATTTYLLKTILASDACKQLLRGEDPCGSKPCAVPSSMPTPHSNPTSSRLSGGVAAASGACMNGACGSSTSSPPVYRSCPQLEYVDCASSAGCAYASSSPGPTSMASQFARRSQQSFGGSPLSPHSCTSADVSPRQSAVHSPVQAVPLDMSATVSATVSPKERVVLAAVLRVVGQACGLSDAGSQLVAGLNAKLAALCASTQLQEEGRHSNGHVGLGAAAGCVGVRRSPHSRPSLLGAQAQQVPGEQQASGCGMATAATAADATAATAQCGGSGPSGGPLRLGMGSDGGAGSTCGSSIWQGPAHGLGDTRGPSGGSSHPAALVHNQLLATHRPPPLKLPAHTASASDDEASPRDPSPSSCSFSSSTGAGSPGSSPLPRTPFSNLSGTGCSANGSSRVPVGFGSGSLRGAGSPSPLSIGPSPLSGGRSSLSLSVASSPGNTARSARSSPLARSTPVFSPSFLSDRSSPARSSPTFLSDPSLTESRPSQTEEQQPWAAALQTPPAPAPLPASPTAQLTPPPHSPGPAVTSSHTSHSPVTSHTSHTSHSLHSANGTSQPHAHSMLSATAVATLISPAALIRAKAKARVLQAALQAHAAAVAEAGALGRAPAMTGTVPTGA